MRRNEAYEREKLRGDMLQRMLDERRRDPGAMPVTGCGDNSCEIAKPSGMVTNGGCCCDERTVRRALRWWKKYAAFLEETIREQKQ